ncbi:MAG TPA: Hsp20/alpha crystallin family protein [Burkholderiaceae bacterium]|jgi:HSP20 family molecular chaperone IbpA|nr:Hsp20/alpha crystallin family protein [Burkholderiaceae bacterium]
MGPRDLSTWMWGDALSLLEQAERLHRQFVRASLSEAQCWEPPVDVVESDGAVLVQVALPGVPAEVVVVGFDPGGITVSGVRAFPASGAARIHRIEIPYGRFHRRIPLPMHVLEPATQELVDGCLLLTFSKAKVSR